MNEFEKLGVQVLSVSMDSVFVHKMWDDHELSKMVEGGIPFPMLSDGGGKVGSVYGVYDANAGVEMRGRFLIDPDGVIQGYEVLTPPVGRNVNETLRQIQAFQLVRESKGAEARQKNAESRARFSRERLGSLESRRGLRLNSDA